MQKKIAIIGAGIGGLYTALAFDEAINKDKYTFVIYERMANVGGLWNFTEDIGIDSSDGLPVHSAVYKNLITNAPNDLAELEFTGLFNENEKHYVNHEKYLEALVKLAEKYNLYQHIKCQHYVKSVEKSENGFSLEIVDTAKTEMITEQFDYVIVAAGRYALPKWPQTEGELLRSFSGKSFHSKDTKDISIYKDKRVLCLGSGYSAQDISLLLHKAGAPFVAVNAKPGVLIDNCTFNWNDSFKLILSPMKAINGKMILFEDGTSDEFDVVIVCTGYLGEFPFLENKLQLEMKNPVFPHLYEAVVNIEYPQLMFINLLPAFLPKICSYLQGHFICDILNNELKNLPDEEKMQQNVQNWYNQIPSTSNIDDFLKFFCDYYNNLQTFSKKIVFDKRHEKFSKFSIKLLLDGTHVEKNDKVLNDFA